MLDVVEHSLSLETFTFLGSDFTSENQISLILPLGLSISFAGSSHFPQSLNGPLLFFSYTTPPIQQFGLLSVF